MGRLESYKEHLFEQLKDPEAAAAYLNAARQDGDPEIFMIALRDVAEACGGMAYVAKAAELNRESLYRTLSSRGNPRYSSLAAILRACELDMTIQPLQTRRSKRPARSEPAKRRPRVLARKAAPAHKVVAEGRCPPKKNKL